MNMERLAVDRSGLGGGNCEMPMTDENDNWAMPSKGNYGSFFANDKLTPETSDFFGQPIYYRSLG